MSCLTITLWEQNETKYRLDRRKKDDLRIQFSGHLSIVLLKHQPNEINHTSFRTIKTNVHVQLIRWRCHMGHFFMFVGRTIGGQIEVTDGMQIFIQFVDKRNARWDIERHHVCLGQLVQMHDE